MFFILNRLMSLILGKPVFKKSISTLSFFQQKHINNKQQLKVLKCIKPLNMEDIVLGQYVGNPENKGDGKFGYTDDKTVPVGSKTPTFACAVVNISNERWDGVPFILKCGKGLVFRLTIQFSTFLDSVCLFNSFR